MDLFVFIRHSDPIKVWIWERDLVKKEVRMLKMTEGHNISLDPLATAASGGCGDSIDKLFNEGVTGDASGSTYPPKKLRDDYMYVPPNTSGKSLATLCGLVLDGSGIPSGVTEPLIAASVALTPDVGPTVRAQLMNLSFQLTVVVTTTVVADVAAIPGSKARVESKNLENVRDYASVGGDNADAASILNYIPNSMLVRAARQVCLGAEVRMQAKHTLEKKGELEDKCVKQATLLSERDAEIVHLKSLLSLKEAEDAEDIHLHGQLTIVEAADAAKYNELKDLKEKKFVLEGEREMLFAKLTSDLSNFHLSHDELNYQVASLEPEKDGLINQRSSLESVFELFSARMEATQDEQARVLGMAIGYAVNKDIQDGLRAGVDHGKAIRDLSVINAYDPSAEAKYVESVNALGAVDFSLLFELKSKKDASIVDLMDSLRLEGPLAKIPIAKNLQPSPE
uniref:Uncharacterized protein n=1 Tax=Tanacetum cinerariifolium TaxID=118510 RepID=A0A6L2K4G8_TANCI|nr:hypothetical protein [Tanacetum cinerariifolium]